MTPEEWNHETADLEEDLLPPDVTNDDMAAVNPDWLKGRKLPVKGLKRPMTKGIMTKLVPLLACIY